MNRKQQRRLRRIKNKEGRKQRREWIRRNLVHWCNEFGYPIVVMDDPTDEHIHMLMLVWLAPRQMASDIAAEVTNQRFDSVVMEALGVKKDSLQGHIWNHLLRLSTFGFVPQMPTEPEPSPIKVW